MKTYNTLIANTLKRAYISPEIECIKLDNEISLQLASGAAPLPGEPDCVYNSPEYMSNDPFNSYLG